jgi:predicted metal-binding protein
LAFQLRLVATWFSTAFSQKKGAIMFWNLFKKTQDVNKYVAEKHKSLQRKSLREKWLEQQKEAFVDFDFSYLYINGSCIELPKCIRRKGEEIIFQTET